jgi:N-acetylglucosamine kinase-like BadF-type ATPase
VSEPPVLGLDIGGSWTRALVIDPVSGARLGVGRRAGANPVTHGVAAASEHIPAAVAQALDEAGTSAASVSACVVGMAGTSKLAGDPAAARAIDGLWRGLGLGCEVEVVSDVAAAFAAGCAEPDGSILLAGTGAVAAVMKARRPVGLRGGHGWMLGDEGSGYWVGREAVRATLAALDDARPLDGLTATVLAHFAPRPDPLAPAAPAAGPLAPDYGLDDGRRLAAAVIAAVNARPAVELATLVPLVTEAAERNDRTASHILHECAELLVATLERARPPQDSTAPIVLAGGVLAPGSLVHRLVSAAIAQCWPKAAVAAGVDGAAGAAWLAALRLLGDGPAAATLHARLLGARTG